MPRQLKKKTQNQFVLSLFPLISLYSVFFFTVGFFTNFNGQDMQLPPLRQLQVRSINICEYALSLQPRESIDFTLLEPNLKLNPKHS